MRRVVDCFPFCHELDLLELRLATLEDVVDYFVIGESPVTHTGNPKPLYYADHKSRFCRWHSKIRHLIVRDMPMIGSHWTRENHQRRSLVRGFPTLQANDVVISSDVDEIPRPEAIMEYDASRGLLGLGCYHSLFYLNTQLLGKQWIGPRVFPYALLNRSDLQEIRWYDAPKWGHVQNDAGWHFSYCGGLSSFMYKVAAYAHRDDVKRQTHDINNVADVLSHPTAERRLLPGASLIGRRIDRTFPDYVQENERELVAKGLIHYGCS